VIWFAIGLPLLLQLLVPACLVAGVALTSAPRARVALAVFTAAYLVAIGIAGLWLVLPWWTPWLYAALLAAAGARPVPQPRAARTPRTAWRTRLVIAGCLMGTLLSMAISAMALRGRRTQTDTVDVRLPFTEGTYLVVNGGMHTLINAHLNTLEGDRFRAYRGQSFGLDLVAINPLGLRAQGVLPRSLQAYRIFGTPVVAPCAGTVVAASDGNPDMTPPIPDRTHMAGNHVIIDCEGAWVVLGHLQRGSVIVRTAQRVSAGDPIGRVGNSGNTSEPHLHVHAQRPGSSEAPLGGTPIALRVDGRTLSRNHRVLAK